MNRNCRLRKTFIPLIFCIFEFWCIGGRAFGPVEPPRKGPVNEKVMSSKLTSSHLRFVWHRRDLRLHDNYLYNNLQESATSTLSAFIFDPKDFEARPSTSRPEDWNAVTVGPHAARILLESVQNLRSSLQNIGGELLIRIGDPAIVLPRLVQETGATEVVWGEEPGTYEKSLSKKVRKAIQESDPNIQIDTCFQYSLYHPDDLPYGGDEWQRYAAPNRKKGNKKKRKNNKSSPPSTIDCKTSGDSYAVNDVRRWQGMPRIMGEFRGAARAKTRPRSCLVTPTRLTLPTRIPDAGEIPSLPSLYQHITDAKQAILGIHHSTIAQAIQNATKLQDSSFATNADVHRGGEDAGLKHLEEFCAKYASSATRNLACVDNHQSSHLSHFLAFGCLSPRRIVEEAEKHGEGCNWIISHMTMRDFFLYTCLASGSQFYALEGIPVSRKAAAQISWKAWKEQSTEDNWKRWALGETGFPLVDAAMKELLVTGYCSNRVRQNVASLLTKDLGVDWRAGAEWFQFLLGDHCVGANWGNWLYFSGVGPDPKQRHFRTISQALKYDENGDYVRKWLPTLKDAQGEEAYLRPWDYNTSLRPIVDPETQYIWQDLERLKETGKLLSQRS